MPNDSMRRDNDLVLDPTQYAYILDATKGGVVCYVGPTRVSLAETDRPVAFVDGKFERQNSIEAAIQQFPVAGEGDYIVLENPEKNGDFPALGNANSNPTLLMGRTVNIHGPASFPLWPGQTAKVVQGHHLRSNQYLVAVVYNEEEAQENWGKAVMKVQETAPKTDDGEGTGEGATPEPKKDESAEDVKAKVGTLTTGKRIVIKGTEISFFMPPTGIEVVPEHGNHVRDAVTLETLEYSILVDENGKKRYVRGPNVVFPEPTEVFVRRSVGTGDDMTRKFKASELNEISGIYIQVIADYEDEDHPLPDVDGEVRTSWKEGEELFITGKEQRIYFPRPEHAIIKYAGQKTEKMYAIAIPAGEARYVLNRLNGDVALVRGPKMFLPDPRKEVIVRRILPEDIVKLWFPGNVEAASYNQQLTQISAEQKTAGGVTEDLIRGLSAKKRSMYKSRSSVMNFAPTEEEMRSAVIGSSLGAGHLPQEAAADAVADEVQRSQTYSAPRSVVLNTKYEGAVLIDVWQGYAVQIKSKTGERKVVVGPKPTLLEYEEGLDVLTLSTGRPKNDSNRLKTVYLQVRNNRVSDSLLAETSDLVKIGVTLAYRVNFEGDSGKWFEVEDYVRLLSEHTRSIVRNHMKKVGVEEFMADSVAMIRDMILGKPHAPSPNEEQEEDGPAIGERPGLKFEENGMVVTDVEVLDVTIGDDEIERQLVHGQHAAVEQAIELKLKTAELERTKKIEQINREIEKEASQTVQQHIVLEQEEAAQKQEAAMQELASQLEQRTAALEVEKASQAINDESGSRALARRRAEADQQFELDRSRTELRVEEAQKRTDMQKALIEAIGPDLIAALQVHGDKVLTASLTEKLTPLASLTGESVPEVFKKLTSGMAIGDVINQLSGNGNARGGIASRISRVPIEDET